MARPWFWQMLPKCFPWTGVFSPHWTHKLRFTIAVTWTVVSAKENWPQFGSFWLLTCRSTPWGTTQLTWPSWWEPLGEPISTGEAPGASGRKLGRRCYSTRTPGPRGQTRAPTRCCWRTSCGPCSSIGWFCSTTPICVRRSGSQSPGQPKGWWSQTTLLLQSTKTTPRLSRGVQRRAVPKSTEMIGNTANAKIRTVIIRR